MPREKKQLPNDDELVGRILEKIDAHLERRTPGPEIAKWAARELYEKDFKSRSMLISVALRSLLQLGFVEPSELCDEDLREIRAALTGKGSYVLKMTRIPSDELRRRLPESAFAPIEDLR
jgi:hypothetical protein